MVDKLDDILPDIMPRLRGKDRPTKRGVRRLQLIFIERFRRVEALQRIGLEAYAVENVYPPPLEPEKPDEPKR